VGNASVQIKNLPDLIHSRFLSEGGNSTFGDLLCGLTEEDCKVAIFERGAISLENATTHVVLGDIFNKWITTRDGVDNLILGYPISEERDTIGGFKSQDFKNGRIYAGLPTGTHYVPSVFVQAIDALGGEVATGIPISDPVRCLPFQVTLFQKFERPDFPQLLASTLEIVGDPPILRVERQGDDLSLLFHEDIDVLLTQNPGTVWREFPCSGALGPCDVSAPTSNQPIEDAGTRFCKGSLFLQPPPPLGPKEWEPILGDYILTPILGIVKAAHGADEDFPYTHDCKAGILQKWRSDYNIFVRPLHPFRNLLTVNRSTVEIEFEMCWFHYGWAAFFDPLPGDLLFASGRWIIDCGHDSYQSEIHPPAIMAMMRTVEYMGTNATQANIWVNEVYTGDPVEFEIYPPPRPSPDAVLCIVRPEGEGVDVNVECSFNFDSPVRIRISSSTIRQPEVTSLGQMRRDENSRLYWGQWHVFWEYWQLIE